MYYISIKVIVLRVIYNDSKKANEQNKLTTVSLLYVLENYLKLKVLYILIYFLNWEYYWFRSSNSLLYFPDTGCAISVKYISS